MRARILSYRIKFPGWSREEFSPVLFRPAGGYFSELPSLTHLDALIMKKCPMCCTQVVESHYYCPECRYPVNTPIIDPGDGTTSILEQIRQGWVSLLLIIGFIGGSVILVRAIDWRSLNLMLHGETMTAEEKNLDKQSVTERLARRKVSRGRNQVTGSAANAPQLAANQESRAQSAPATDLAVASSSGAAAVERTANRANHSDDQSVEIEQFEAPPTDQTGIVTIKSQATARVYIDGQYSGVTPRTVNLNAGEHQVRLVSDGYLEWNDRIQVRSRKQTGVLASMTRNE